MPNENQKAAANELRKFLAQMRGQSPKEMLGAVASSNLVHSTLTATAAITIAIVVFTIIPFGIEQVFGKSSADASPSSSEAQPHSAEPLNTPPEPRIDPDADTSAADKLGIGDSKQAPSNLNPLESSTGDLLEGLE